MDAARASQRAVGVAAAACVAAISGCATFDSPSGGSPVAAPVYRVGDRWVYRAAEGLPVKAVWQETHEVVAIDAAGITVRIVRHGDAPDKTRDEIWPEPGLVRVGAIYDDETRRFAVPLKRLAFPLAAGETWYQHVDSSDEATAKRGTIARYGRVLGRESIATPAGTFDAIKVYVIMRLDDDEFWRASTECNYIAWYAPEMRAIVREDRRAHYYERDGGAENGALIVTQKAVVELLSFAPGR